ncbi:hypothetical protein KR009_011570 [Drosophila setifemur]|nr:hypothetical protein KR009_011570 [Drosophila setifemur]
MGCASSTPMVATAGSEMLKAATHVREKGEAVVEDASQTLATTMDTAKETVGSAVAGITNELGNAFKDGTQALDEAKHKVMEGLHLEKPQESKEVEAEVEMSSSRAPTPELQADADSLKTSTPEPEIERALANEEESPPSPKPSLEEMAKLKAVVEQAVEAASAGDAAAPPAVTADAAPAPDPATESSAPAPATVEVPKIRKVRPKFVDLKEEEQKRPNTTEWEKFADQLSKSKKFKPYESFAHSQNKFSVYKDHTSLRDKPNHYDGHFSGGNSLSSTSISDLSSGHVTPAMTRKGQREFAKFVASEQPASVSRSNSRLSNPAGSRLSNPAGSRTFDFNPQRDRITLPMASRIGSGIQRAPMERISGWGRGRPSVLEEEPGYGRRMSTGLMQNPLRPEREKFVPSGRSRAVLPITPTKDARRDKSSRKSASNLSASRESSYLEFDPMKSEKSSKTIPKPVRSREPSYTDFDSIKSEKATQRVSRESTLTEFSSRKSDKSPLSIGKAITKEAVRSREPSYTEFDSLKSNKILLKDKKQKEKEDDAVRSREPSYTEFDTLRAVKTPLKIPKSRDDIPIIPQRELNPSPEPESSLNQNQSPVPRREPPEPAVASSKKPSSSTSRVSSSNSADSSNLDVVIEPMSNLATPSLKSFSQSPDQVVLEGYEDSDLEAALARLEILRGSTTTLQSLRSCSPGRHTYTASLLSSRRTSPWVMRKSYKGSLSNKENQISSLKSSQPGHQSLERCDICCNEFVLN